MSITWRRFPEMERTCPVRLSMRGTSALPSTGLMRFFFWPVNALIATIRAFAEPCLPGLDFSNSTILHGSPSMMTYWPIFKLPTSTGLFMKLRPDGQPSRTSSKSLMTMLRFVMVLGELGLVSDNFQMGRSVGSYIRDFAGGPKPIWRNCRGRSVLTRLCKTRALLQCLQKVLYQVVRVFNTHGETK